MRPKLLDLFCGAGGAGMGYYRAGFDVTGVDIEPQPRYPFAFVQANALEYVAEHGREYDAIHASPPCQFASIMRNLPWLKDKQYPALIAPTRKLLLEVNKPYIIENVAGARFGSKMLAKLGLAHHGLKAGWLCGGMFGLPLYRHRYFETNWFWLQPAHPKHSASIRKGRMIGDRAREIVYGNGAQRVGANVVHAKGWRIAAVGMGIDWMDRDGLSQAIPPAFTEYLGRTLLSRILAAEAVT